MDQRVAPPGDDRARPAESLLARLDPTRPPLRWILRFPVLLYRAHLDWLLGSRFVELTVRGRKSGLPRRVVLEVVGRDRTSGELVIVSAWGRRAQWFRNVRACPRVQVRVGRRRAVAEIVPLDEAAAAQRLRQYAREHRWAYRWFIGPLLLGHRPAETSGEFAGLAREVPVLLVRPAG